MAPRTQDLSSFRFGSNPANLFRLFMIVLVSGYGTVSAGCLGREPVQPGVRAGASATSLPGSPEGRRDRAIQAHQRGAFTEAASDWLELARYYREAGDLRDEADALTKLARAYQALGHYDKALRSAESALVLAKKADDRREVAVALGILGDNYLATGPTDRARVCLDEALTVAESLKDAGLSASLHNSMGNLAAANHQYQMAVDCYEKSAVLAEVNMDHPMAATALNNAAIASIQSGAFSRGKGFADRAAGFVQTMVASHDKAYALINVGSCYLKLYRHLSGSAEGLYAAAERAFHEAVAVSEEINDPRAVAYGCGYLGELYEQGRHYDAALQQCNKAVLAAQRARSPESLYRWQWQTGRLFKATGRQGAAIAAYREAIATLQSIRVEMSGCYGRAGMPFREAAGPLYLEFVDLLLQQAAAGSTHGEYESRLREAREVVELLRVYELRDYFRDDCLASVRTVTTQLDEVSRNTLVIYPIILADRTELLVSLPTGMKLFTVRVAAAVFAEEIRSLRRQLEKLTTREYLPQAQKLYEWLIRPMEEDLQSSAVDTIVFVPDGPLRTIPMAALHDGNAFLIQKYAVAVTPGLDLTDPRPIARKHARVLALGLTEAAQGYPPLPYVSLELEAIEQHYQGKVLLNRDFVLPAMGKSLSDEPFTIVHIASHGQFAGEVEKTFLLAFDSKLTMDLLDQYVGLFRLREEPLELLTLSACETAAGDDRAALGLAGVAVKAGARSALATLWYINDQASSILVAEFYRQLLNPSVSRAAALQRAQLHLLADRRYQHPRYWSPYLLINNWL